MDYTRSFWASDQSVDHNSCLSKLKLLRWQIRLLHQPRLQSFSRLQPVPIAI